MSRENLDQQVTGPIVTLAAKVKAALEAADLDVSLPWGTFYVGRVELRWADHGETEVVGYLVPDEGDGKTFDFYTPQDANYTSG